MADAKLFIDPSTLKAAEDILKSIEESARGPAMIKVMREAGKLLENRVKTLLPKPGYPGDKPDLVPLRNTLHTRVRDYQNKAFRVMITGYAYPAGAHGHLVEEGHEKVLWGYRVEGEQVPPHPYFARAVEEVKNEIHNHIINGAKRVANA